MIDEVEIQKTTGGGRLLLIASCCNFEGISHSCLHEGFIIQRGIIETEGDSHETNSCTVITSNAI